MQLSGTGTPLFRATRILPSAIVQADMSRIIGGPSATGIAGRDRVGREPAVDAAERSDQDAGPGRVDEMQRQLAGPGRHERPVADPAQMAGVPQGDHGHAVPAAFVDAQLHRLLADGLAEAELAIDDGDGLVFEDDLDRLIGQHLAGPQPLHVGRRRG